jgi:hypothetical protein
MIQPHRPQMTIWCMRIACWITKATDTHSEYVILIAFPLRQWLRTCASKLRYTYIVYLVYIGHTVLWHKTTQNVEIRNRSILTVQSMSTS